VVYPVINRFLDAVVTGRIGAWFSKAALTALAFRVVGLEVVFAGLVQCSYFLPV
jgi:hypothetical protein